LLGIIIGRNQWLRAGCGPLLVILASFPALAVYPVIMIIVGLSEWSKWIIVVVSTFFIMLYWTRTVVAVRVNAYLQVATGAGREAPGRASVMRLGWVKPYFLGLKLAAWVGLLTLIPAEFVGAKSGIGYVIWMSWQSFHVAQMYVGIALAGALGRWRGWPSISWSG
jgi:NitT/TauT family transport system permease protein